MDADRVDETGSDEQEEQVWRPPPEAPDSFGDGDDHERLEPGSPTAENTLFVLLGALATVFVFVQMVPVI